MSLFITVKGQKITGYGKTGNIEINSYPSVDGQPVEKDLCYWNGSQVQLKTTQMLVDEYAEEKIFGENGIREILYTRWPDSGKTISALKAEYDNVKNASSGWTTFEQVDTAYNNYISFMNLS